VVKIRPYLTIEYFGEKRLDLLAGDYEEEVPSCEGRANPAVREKIDKFSGCL